MNPLGEPSFFPGGRIRVDCVLIAVVTDIFELSGDGIESLNLVRISIAWHEAARNRKINCSANLGIKLTQGLGSIFICLCGVALTLTLSERVLRLVWNLPTRDLDLSLPPSFLVSRERFALSRAHQRVLDSETISVAS